MSVPNQYQKLYAPFDFSFPFPTNRAFEVQMPERDFRVLMLAALDNISGAVGAARKPVSSTAAITQTVSTLATLTEGRIVSVANYGPDPVTLSFGDVVAVAGAGTYMLLAGGQYETPIPVIGKVTAICGAGKTAAINLTLF